MREKLIFILLVASLNTYAQRRNDTIFCGIPKLTPSDLILKKDLANSNSDPLVLISGNPGPATTIRMRCISTVQSGNETLFVVDGIPYETKQIKSIKPDDIETIDILKSPIAEGVFGCKALNGVVIITTKKAHERSLTIKDAKDGTSIGFATIIATSLITRDSVIFLADESGRAKTGLLKSLNYKLKITCVGYKSIELKLADVVKNKHVILLEKSIPKMEEITISGYAISCRRICNGRFISVSKNSSGKEHLPALSDVIKVFPNPASSSGTINISFPNVKPGLYQIRMLNAAGQLFYSFQKQISGKNETEQIHLGNHILAGHYILQVMDEQKNTVQSSKLIVQ